MYRKDPHETGFPNRIPFIQWGITLLLLFTGSLQAQGTLSPVNMALGGGGTAYTTGYEAVFVNPANLQIREKNYRYQMAAAMFGTRFSSPVRYNGSETYLEGYFEQIDFFSPAQSVSLPEGERDRFISDNYQDQHTQSQHLSGGELHLFGAQWFVLDRSYAISLRSRYSNRYEVGRNYYDPYPVEVGNQAEYNRSLNHQFQSFYELSFGYAESFTFLNGLIPQLSQLIIGIAPKLIASGAYFDASYTNKRVWKENSSDYQNRRKYQQYSTGPFSSLSRQFTANPERTLASSPVNNRKDLFGITGYGAGIDLGLTYLITLGDDLSAIQDEEATTRKSLRVSFSVTDIGFLTYQDDPAFYSFEESTEEFRPAVPPSDIVFTGQPGEQFYFLNQNHSHPIHETNEFRGENFSVWLPTALNAGLLFQISRIKLTGDFSLGFTDNAFNTKRFITYLGTEIHILPYLPIRAGTRIGHNLPGYYSFGGGIETRYFDINIAFQLRSKSAGPTNELSGLSVAAIKLYIP
ncbi:MAG: DUF5723 family protein [Balneolaceae bacterium]